ncbi:MAG: phasin family protein [Magnetospirillum sp.]|nr:phasin family protein [Magnetospirillum sp.]
MKIDGYDKFMTLGRDNADALIRSGAAALKGFEEMSKASQTLAAKTAEQVDAAVRALFACRTPTDVADLQNKLARESIETAIAQGRMLVELATTTYTAALEPLNARFAAFQTTAKTAA